MKIHFAFCRHSQGNGQALCIKQLLVAADLRGIQHGAPKSFPGGKKGPTVVG